MAKDSKDIKVVWDSVEATHEERENRLSKAFEILFEELFKKEKIYKITKRSLYDRLHSTNYCGDCH